MFAGDRVTCNAFKSNDSDDASITSCHVTHSSNTVPRFNCSRRLSNNASSTTEIRPRGAICPVDNTAYSSTTVAVNDDDLDEPLQCVVSYRSPTDPSNIYLTEHFVVSRKVQWLDVQDTTLSIPTGTNDRCLLGLFGWDHSGPLCHALSLWT